VITSGEGGNFNAVQKVEIWSPDASAKDLADGDVRNTGIIISKSGVHPLPSAERLEREESPDIVNLENVNITRFKGYKGYGVG